MYIIIIIIYIFSFAIYYIYNPIIINGYYFISLVRYLDIFKTYTYISNLKNKFNKYEKYIFIKVNSLKYVYLCCHY